MTRDPNTGRVFRLSKKKEKTQERLALEAAVKTAKSNLSRYLRDSGLNPEAGESSPENTELVRVLSDAKASLASYKEAHPQEFEAPPNKGRKSKQISA